MFLNLPEIRPDRPLESDLCIVGTGAAGITLAKEFIGHSCKVLLIESGGLAADAEITDLYRGGIAPEGKFHRGIHEGRARVFGGTTTLWGGQALPLSNIDFEARSWVSDSGWPFTASELEPYHERARDILGLSDIKFDANIHESFGIRRPRFDPEILSYIYSQWSPHPNFGTAYRQCLATAENVCVVLKGNVTQILPARDGSKVERLELKSLSGETHIVRAKEYVICCGGIETPRLLLASNRVQPEGIGNSHDLVGRYFQDHLIVRWANFVPTNRSRVDALFSSFYRKRLKYYPLLSAAESFQRRERILNISAAIHFDNAPDSGIEVSKRVYHALRSGKVGAISGADAIKLFSRFPEVVRSAYRVLFQHRSYIQPRAPLYLGSTIEQEPNFQSRVLLDNKLDALGMPRVIVDWRLTPMVHRTLVAFAGAVRLEFERVGLGRVHLHPWLLAKDSEWNENMMDNFHHMGATRMHANPRFGVVDANCRVHGIENLYLGSSSVFPTGGHSNPTFTLLLLCLRLADRLKRSLI